MKVEANIGRSTRRGYSVHRAGLVGFVVRRMWNMRPDRRNILAHAFVNRAQKRVTRLFRKSGERILDVMDSLDIGGRTGGINLGNQRMLGTQDLAADAGEGRDELSICRVLHLQCLPIRSQLKLKM